MDLAELFQRLGIAVGLGLIVGLQRERSGSPMAGLRTFALITLFGALCGYLAREFGGFVPASGLLALAAVIVVGQLERHEDKPGATTEMSMLVMYVVGCMVMTGHVGLAVATGGSVAVLLHLKPQLHSVAHRI